MISLLYELSGPTNKAGTSEIKTTLVRQLIKLLNFKECKINGADHFDFRLRKKKKIKSLTLPE